MFKLKNLYQDYQHTLFYNKLINKIMLIINKGLINIWLNLFYIFLITNIITSCSKYNSAKLNYNLYNRAKPNKQIYNNLVCEEYINRVAKLLLIVDNNNTIRDIDFGIKNHPLPSLEIITIPNLATNNSYQVIISTGVLNYLQDEAELATILAITLERINHNFALEHLNSTIAHKADLRIIQHLYMAGYDPKAFTELQAEFLRKHHTTDNWLKFLFANSNLNKHRILLNNKAIASLKIFKGLKRDKQAYLSHVYLLKN